MEKRRKVEIPTDYYREEKGVFSVREWEQGVWTDRALAAIDATSRLTNPL